MIIIDQLIKLQNKIDPPVIILDLGVNHKLVNITRIVHE